ncbi:hypothetical protein BDA96_08G200500 [Sorghum bicolor]|uniref:DUF4220 domain-containing protein n=1 Tax=Sorghum bicolor TaxID=4558 RepID=A0A921QHC2_SORBI|nr:hypothetical protein BDA96_08G200500 [Sorghum bicolor]
MEVYRRIGNTGQQHLVNNATSTSFLHQLRDLWESPRGTVLRIEALALVAILLSFFLAAFGTCRRWSNSWIIQKGFLAANALFLSLGTYSIGLMQSSQVKSEMYPIWAVSLLALLCCVDSASMSGIGNEGQIWKLLYQLCLYFGYVVLMSISTISSDIGNIAICVLSAVTLIKGFHRSMAVFVLPSSMRNAIREVPAHITARRCSFGDHDERSELPVDMKLDIMVEDGVVHEVSMGDIASLRFRDADLKLESDLRACKDVCFSLSLSHLLRRRLLGLSSSSAEPTATTMSSTEPLVESYERASKVVEIELAFMYDMLYTSNVFLHYYEERSCSIWAVASVLGICFVGAVAVMPGARTTRHASPGTISVHTTVADSVITGVILVSLVLLQVLQLLRCWTSNWARVTFACDLVRHVRERKYTLILGPGRRVRRIPRQGYRVRRADLSLVLRLRASLLKINWSDDKHYLWQKKLGQHSVVESIRLPGSRCHRLFCCGFLELGAPRMCVVARKCWALFGLRYMGRVLQELLQTSNTERALELHPDVTASIGEFVEKIRCNDVSAWASTKLEEDNLRGQIKHFYGDDAMDDIYVPCILMWHTATCYCQLVAQVAVAAAVDKDRRVAMALSKYCAYLVVSAPRLLPGRSDATAMVYAEVRDAAIQNVVKVSSSSLSSSAADKLLLAMENSEHRYTGVGSFVYMMGVKLGKELVRTMPADDRWKVLAEFWVKALVLAAPSDNAEEHLQHLAQGGELITHLWAMLYHAGIRKWQLTPPPQIKMGWDYIFRIRSLEDLYRPPIASPLLHYE